MKSRTLMFVTAMSLFAALALPVPLAAQHTRYKLIDLGTLGGPQSHVNIPETSYAPVLNNRGILVGWADTPMADPYPGFCFNEEDPCFLAHAFQWQKGVTTDLSALPGGASSRANWISANGLVTGASQNGEIDPLISSFPELRAVLWKHGELINLGTLPGGHESVATAVNSHGQVVGWALNVTPDNVPAVGGGPSQGLGYQTRAFVWQNGSMQDLGTLGSGTDAIALLVNERGQVAGDTLTSSTPNRGLSPCGEFTTNVPTQEPFLWENGRIRGLGTLGGTCGYVFSLNNRGQVVGQSDLRGDLDFHAFLWDQRMLDLGTFGGSLSTAIANNDDGDVVGWATYPGDQLLRAFLWKNGAMNDLGALNDDPCSMGFSINSRRQIVGVSISGCDFGQPTANRAFLWDSGSIVDLNTLIPADSLLHLAFPETINDRGEIAGVGFLPNGDAHAFLLIPCGPDDTEGCQDVIVGTTSLSPSPAMQRATITSQSNLFLRIAGQRLAVGRFRKSARKAALNGNAVVTAAIATLSPTSLTFSAQALGTRSSAKTVTLKNSGNAMLTITAIAITGTNPGDFAQTHTCGSSLAPGASCSISITFKPTASGTRQAALSVTDNAAGSPQHVPLSGIGTTAKLSPTSLSFGTVSVGTTSAAKSVTLTNVGTTTLTIAGIAITGTNAADFSETHTCGSSLAAGVSCAFSIKFKPTVSGSRTAAMKVTDNAAGSPQQVSLSGTGVVPGKCTPRGQQCAPVFPPCCPGLVCVPASTRAFCE